MQYQHGGDIYSQDIDIDYSANLSPLGLPDGVKERLSACLEDGTCCVYPDSRCQKLVSALSGHHGVPESWIICGNGAADLIFGLACAGGREGRCLVTAPTFSEYGQAMEVCGYSVDQMVLSEENGFMPDMERFSETVRRAGEDGKPYDMVFLCNPNNPTGIPVRAEEVRKAAEACSRTGSLLIVDECFCGFLDEPEEYSVAGDLGRFRNLFILKAFTKLYAMAGLRLGYGLCSDAALVERLRQVRQPWSVSGLAQEAGAAALKETVYVERVREVIRLERDWLKGQLEALGFTVYDSRANYILFKVWESVGTSGTGPTGPTGTSGTGPTGTSGTGYIGTSGPASDGKGWLYHRLLSRKVLIRSCGNYPGLDASFYRICVKTREENERLMEHMRDAVTEHTAEIYSGSV